jgi:iron complex outermembrane receptor protein
MVNVVTRGTRGEPGVHASLRAGSGDDLRVQADARARSERGIAWAITGSFRSARGADLFFPEFADGPLGGEARGLDSEREANLFMHANWGAHSFALKLNDRMKGVPTASYGTEFGASNLRTWDRRDYFEWNTVASPNRAAELQIRAYWDGARYHGMYPYGPSGAQQLNIDRGDSDALGAEAKIHVAPRAGQTLTAGIEGREIARVRLFNADVGASTPNFDRTFRNEFVPGAYVQHEVRWRHLIRTTLGARVDHYQSFGAVLSPRGDIVWRASPATTLKLLAGSAFRAPSAYEYRYADPSQLANPDLQPERILSYEASIDRLFGPVRTTVSAYQNQIRDLIDQVALDDTGTLLQFRNVDRVTSRGVEAGFEWSPHAGRSLSGDIAWQLSKDSEADNELSNSPRWNAHLLAMYAPEESRWSLGASVRALSPRRTLSGSRTGDAVVADARVGRRVSGEVEVALQARNVFDSRFSDPASSEFLQDKIAQDGRRFFLAVSFRPAVRR